MIPILIYTVKMYILPTFNVNWHWTDNILNYFNFIPFDKKEPQSTIDFILGIISNIIIVYVLTFVINKVSTTNSPSQRA